MMTINRAMALATILAILPLTRPAAALDDEKAGIDGDGYISTWLVLAPIPLEKDQAGADGLAKAQVKDEASLKPKAGDKIEVDGKELTWKEAGTKEGVLNFNELLGSVTAESVAYAVSTIVAEEEKSDVTLKVGSDDQVRIFLNGKQIHSNDEARPLEKDQDSIGGITLKKGRNVLVVKVVNGADDWQSSVRFLDKDGAPIKGITATTKPE
jgi:hypothetical protein